MGAQRMPVTALTVLILAALVLPSIPVPANAQVRDPRSNPGWTLIALDPADLDAIAGSLGARAGVMIASILPGSRAAAAGCIQGEIVYAVDGKLVDTPAALDAALAAGTGKAELVGFVIGPDGTIQVVKRILAPVSGAPATGSVAAGSPISGSPAAGSVAVNDLSRTGTTYRHPIGFVFWYPASFTVKEIENGIELVPAASAAGQAGGPGQPSEMYFVTGESIQGTGITSPMDQRVITYLDNLVKTKVSPYLQRTAAPSRVAMTNGEGSLMEWSVPGQNGKTVIARIFTSIMKDFGVFLGAVGEKSLVDSRDPDLRGMFASFSSEAGKLDQSIAGAWRLFSTREIRNEDKLNFTVDDPRRASMVSDEQTTLELFPDGSARRTSISRTIAHGGVSGGSSTVWIDSGDQKTVKQGRWNAGNGTLFIMWQDNRMEQWQYGIVRDAGGISLKLATAGRIQFWQKR
ncbi:MAG: hypothetical protein Q8O15_03215 [Rectinemataceae bacterium]|nr:hypothetical protein [Rectinemataceae bacterium]